jgi:hypothetical protein
MGETTVVVDVEAGVVVEIDAGRPFWIGMVCPVDPASDAAMLPKKKLLNDVAIDEALEGVEVGFGPLSGWSIKLKRTIQVSLTSNQIGTHVQKKDNARSYPDCSQIDHLSKQVYFRPEPPSQHQACRGRVVAGSLAGQKAMISP